MQRFGLATCAKVTLRRPSLGRLFVHSTRLVSRISTVHLRAFVAAALALGLVLGIAALAWAAPAVSIDSGPSGPTNDTTPVFGFTVDSSATTVECSIDQGTPFYLPCSDTYAPLVPLPEGDYTFRVRAGDGVDETVATRDFTVDTTRPSLSIDSGASGPTNDATPTFGFTTDAQTIECSIDDGTPAYAPCTSPYTPGAPLSDGSYTFRVRATDAAGNQASDSQTFSVDTAAPSLSIDSGPTGLTNDRTPTFGFTSDAPGVECSVDQGSPSYGSCSRTTSHTTGTLADGSYTFRVRVADAAGNEAVATRSFTVDATPPPVSIGSGPSGLTNDATPSFGFTAEVGATVECSIDQGSPSYAVCTSPYTPAVPLSDGSYTFRVRATDAAGNQASDSQAFSVDATPPSLSIDSGPAGLTNDRTPSFGFTTNASRVECSVDQGTPAYGSCSTASSHTAAALGDGSYTFRVRATDAAGNEARATRSFTVDATPPSVSIESAPAITSDTTPSFEFAAEAGASVVCSVDQGSPAYGPCTSPYVSRALLDGNYTFRVRATDAAGNQMTDSQAFEVDSAAPSLSIDSGPSGPTNDATPSFAFTAELGTRRVECSLAAGSPSYAPCVSPYVSAALPDGSYTFLVRATDGVGNQAVETRSLMVDTVPPSLSIAFGPSGTTTDSTPLFGFAAERGAMTECSIDQGTAAYGACASATTHAAGAPLADGAYVFRVRATDAAGNQTTSTRAFTVDTVPDVPPPGTSTPDPAPPTTPRSEPQLLSPFPLVRISGTLTSTGARIRLLSVRAPRGALVRVTVRPACARRSSRRCRVLRAGGTVGRRGVIGFRGLARAYRSGTVIVVRVWRADRIGKYTRFTIVRGKAPRRVDQCLMPGAARGIRCPSG